MKVIYLVGDVRYHKGISIRELAKRAHVSKSHLQNIEAGLASPSFEVMLRLAYALEVPLEELFRVEER